MMWKLATLDDLDYIVSYLNKDEVRIASGLTTMPRDEYINYTRKLLSNKEYSTWLHIEDGELNQYFTCYDFKSLPYYVIFNYRKVAKPTKLFSIFHEKFNEVLDFIVPKQEAKNLYSFYLLRVSIRNGRKLTFERQSTNMKGDMHLFFKRYFRVIEEYIPKGQTSTSETFRTLMFRGVTFPEDVYITKYICKQEYRTNCPQEFQQNYLAAIGNIEQKFEDKNDL